MNAPLNLYDSRVGSEECWEVRGALWEDLWETPVKLCVLREGMLYRRVDKDSPCPLLSCRPGHGPGCRRPSGLTSSC